ncbi:MAG: hypothetical protein Q9219_003467 [cf. Caloplaca sp. 3 TL-2023]
MTGSQQDRPEQTKTVCINSRQNCLFSALDILRDLHIPPSACLYSINDSTALNNKRQPRQTDSVFSTNHNVVRRLSDMLRCPCTSMCPVQLVLNVICNKLIAWYRAILQGSGDQCRNATSSPTKLNQTATYNTHELACEEASEQVLHQTFCVGNYQFDPDLDRKICAQVVASELQQLELMVGNFTNRLQTEGIYRLDSLADHQNGNSDMRIKSTGLPGEIAASLTTQLYQNLWDTKAKIPRVSWKSRE